MPSSQLYPGEMVIDDSTPESVTHVGGARGLDLSNRGLGSDYVYGNLADPFPEELEIPESEWQARIQELEETKTNVSSLIRAAGLPAKNQKSTNYCFPAGTLIRMADGTHKPIEQVRVLDQVLTAEGRVRRVLKTVVHEVNEPLYRLKVWGHNHLRATSEHPILTNRGYVPIGELKIGDKVAFPKYAPRTHRFIVTGDYLYEKNHVPQARRKYRTKNHAPAGGSTQVVGVPGRTVVRITRHPVPDIIELTPEFGRIAGLYLAEGHTSFGGVFFSFNANERDTLAAECVELIRKALGCEPHVRVRKTVCQVTIHGAKWSQLFDSLFARGSAHKRLCPDLASGPQEFLAEVLRGWMDGDRKKGNHGVTISRQMSLNMFDIANFLGNLPVLMTHQYPKIGSDGRPRQHSWQIGWGQKINHGTEQDDTHMWRTVRGLEQEEFSGHVFNIEVEDDNSYVAEGIGVHNCWIFAPTHACEYARVIQNQPMVSLSPASAGAKIKGYRNLGGWGKEGLQFIAEHGLVPSDKWPDTAINRRYDTVNNRNVALNYRQTEWWELRSRSKKQLISALLRRVAVALGYNWWRHEVMGADPVWLDGEVALRIRNQWQGWGDDNFGILRGNKMLPDDAVAPRVMIAA